MLFYLGNSIVVNVLEELIKDLYALEDLKWDIVSQKNLKG
jgi:hypothetical protein